MGWSSEPERGFGGRGFCNKQTEWDSNLGNLGWMNGLGIRIIHYMDYLWVCYDTLASKILLLYVEFKSLEIFLFACDVVCVICDVM